mmetsp:Transcript_17121/g.27333  ORF Transcript_17121/g.27333 Transcript_17121/m.27333 type:complete len:213 (+) Transcript_17121:484-1122(+)
MHQTGAIGRTQMRLPILAGFPHIFASLYIVPPILDIQHILDNKHMSCYRKSIAFVGRCFVALSAAPDLHHNMSIVRIVHGSKRVLNDRILAVLIRDLRFVHSVRLRLPNHHQKLLLILSTLIDTNHNVVGMVLILVEFRRVVVRFAARIVWQQPNLLHFRLQFALLLQRVILQLGQQFLAQIHLLHQLQANVFLNHAAFVQLRTVQTIIHGV